MGGVIGGLNITNTDHVGSAYAFLMSSSLSSSTWIMAMVDIDYNIKMVQLVVSISGGSAYVYQAAAGYTDSPVDLTSQLTSAPVLSAWGRQTSQSIASSASSMGYGAAIIAYTGL